MSNIEKTNSFPTQRSLETYAPTDRLGKRFPFPSKERVPSGSRKGQRANLLFTPIHYEPGYAYPLLIWFHGPGSDETELFRIMPQLSLRNYVAAAARGLTPEEMDSDPLLRQRLVGNCFSQFQPLYDWPETDDGIEEAENRVVETIEHAKRSCNIADHRVFFAGVNAGGTMALRLGTRHPEWVAGIIAFSSRFPENHHPLQRWTQIRDLPIMMTIGSKNPVFGPNTLSDQLRLFHTAGMSVSIRQYKTAEELTPQMLQDANRWMMDIILK